MKRISLNNDNVVQINGKVVFSFEEFNQICEETGYQNPFVEGKAVMYDKGVGLSVINEENHLGKSDGLKHPEYEIFIDHIDKILKIRGLLRKKEEEDRFEKMPNEAKRKSPLSFGGYGTVSEQLDILVEQGIEGLRSHRASVDQEFPIGD